MTNSYVFINGFILGISLVIALGPQNVFLIRQGAKRNYPGLSAFICFICDIIMVAGSVIGLHHLLELHPVFEEIMIILGSLFLFYYGGNAIYSSLQIKRADRPKYNNKIHSRLEIIVLSLGFSLLNPQALIDTIVIIGSNSSQFPHHEFSFTIGVLLSSMIWFCSITATTVYFSDILTREKIWARFELASGVLMFVIGVKLLAQMFR